jgi:hypothetical protein
MHQSSDVLITGGGTIYVFTALTAIAKQWVEENIHIEGHMILGAGFACEHRYAGDLVAGMQHAGLRVS